MCVSDESLWCNNYALASEVFNLVVKERVFTGWCREAVLEGGILSSAITSFHSRLNGMGDADLDAYDGGSLEEPPSRSVVRSTSNNDGGGRTDQSDDLFHVADLPGIITSSPDEIIEAVMAHPSKESSDGNDISVPGGNVSVNDDCASSSSNDDAADDNDEETPPLAAGGNMMNLLAGPLGSVLSTRAYMDSDYGYR